MSIAADFSDFGSDITGLRKRLRASGVRIYDHFPEYGKDMRRRLGVESEQAMELFHQTVSMKSVGDLNDFVRSHMLEPFDAKSWIDRLVAHFEDLTKSYDAVVKARSQFEKLEPIIDDCDAYDALGKEIEGLESERAALPYFMAERKTALLETRIGEVEGEITTRRAERGRLSRRRRELDEKRQDLVVERAGHGGDRLAEIERAIGEAEHVRDDRRERWNEYNGRLRAAGLGEVEQADQFGTRRSEIDAEAARAEAEETDIQNRTTEVAVDQKDAEKESEELQAELRSLRSRRSNIPARNLELRAWLCRELDLPESSLPFAGEMIQVRGEWAEWEGAAERLLRGFGLSMLVPDEQYGRVSDWINDHHLGARLVYYRVPRSVTPPPEPGSAERQLATRLEIKDSEFYPWLERELAHRAGFDCVETMDEFRRAPRAITKSGQIKDRGGRHEKDDRKRIGDRSEYVLGWSNEHKIDTLLERAGKVQRRLKS